MPPRRKVRLSLRTRRDLRKAYDWYERERTGLGGRFAAAFVEAIDLALERPTSFPISLFFRLVDDETHVVGVIHLHRRPSAWRRRS